MPDVLNRSLILIVLLLAVGAALFLLDPANKTFYCDDEWLYSARLRKCSTGAKPGSLTGWASLPRADNTNISRGNIFEK